MLVYYEPRSACLFCATTLSAIRLSKAGIGSGDDSKRAKRVFCARQGVDKMRVGASSVASFSPSIPRRVGRRTRGGIVCRAVYAVCFSDRRRWQRWRLPAALAFSSSLVFVDSEIGTERGAYLVGRARLLLADGAAVCVAANLVAGGRSVVPVAWGLFASLCFLSSS